MNGCFYFKGHFTGLHLLTIFFQRCKNALGILIKKYFFSYFCTGQYSILLYFQYCFTPCFRWYAAQCRMIAVTDIFCKRFVDQMIKLFSKFHGSKLKKPPDISGGFSILLYYFIVPGS